MWQHEYVNEKLRELDREQFTRRVIAGRSPAGKPVFGPALGLAGRTLRRLGEGLEAWASPRHAEAECRLELDRETG